MKIKFLKDCEVNVMDLSDDGNPIHSLSYFKEGDVIEAEVSGFGNDSYLLPQLQLPDGTYTGCLSKDWFEFVDEESELEYEDEYGSMCG
jgi:hypothetical protein